MIIKRDFFFSSLFHFFFFRYLYTEADREKLARWLKFNGSGSSIDRFDPLILQLVEERLSFSIALWIRDR